jgi:hypothetical protein
MHQSRGSAGGDYEMLFLLLLAAFLITVLMGVSRHA